MWKLIYVPAEGDRKLLTGDQYELYNTDEDPLDEHNLAGQGIKVEKELARHLAKWFAYWNDYSPPTAISPEVLQETLEGLQALGYV